jgi:ElaB/YqjD/DUF883 family membrane-anchored ribosome-binding protein
MALRKTKTEEIQSEATNGGIQAVDVPVGVVTRVAEFVRPHVEPLRDAETREPQLQKLREQVVTELKRSETRGAQIRKKAVDEWPTLRDRFEKELKQTRDRVETEVRKVTTAAKERVSRS